MSSFSASTAEHMLSVVDLVDQPGASKAIDFQTPVPGGLELPLVEVVSPLRVRGVVESLVDGMLVRGALEATRRMVCGRCVSGLEASDPLELVEHFADASRSEVEPEEGYEVIEGWLDLDAMLRDAIAQAVPLRPLCRQDCAGLCPDCGADLNTKVCDCTDDEVDPRWAPLLGLRLPDESS
jgi:uncharacterized protein